MSSEEYVQTVESLMNYQNNYVGWVLAILGLLIGLAAFYQWRLSEGDKETLRKETDNKFFELKSKIDIQISDLEKKNESKISDLKEQVSIKSGINSNGYWTRYPDGNQICRYTIKIDKDVFQKDISWSYPARFYDKDIMLFTEVEDNNKVAVKKIIKEELQVIVLLHKLGTFTEVGDTRINLVAFGKWKPNINE